MTSNVNATSCAVNGCPSFHCTPLRIVNSIDFFPGPQAYEDASIGVSSALRRMFTKTSGSYTKPSETALTAGLNGLNWQIHVCPCTFAMVTVPPCLCPVCADVPPGDDGGVVVFF